MQVVYGAGTLQTLPRHDRECEFPSGRPELCIQTIRGLQMAHGLGLSNLRERAEWYPPFYEEEESAE